MLILVLFILTLGAWIYDKGQSFAGFDSRQSAQDLKDLRSDIARLSGESVRLRDLVASSENKLQIEKVTQASLISQIKSLENENGRLREELAVFERLASGDPKVAGASIHRLEVEPEPEPGHYRYRMLLSASSNTQGKDFQGRLRFSATVWSGDKTAMLAIPILGDATATNNPLTFRRFRRIEGKFVLPSGSKLQAVEASLFQGDSLLATQRLKF